MDDATEAYIMLLLADGNLPTGSFVASAGLESYVKHGFFGASLSEPSASSSATRVNQAVVNFIEDSLGTYAHSALPFVSDAHIAFSVYRDRDDAADEDGAGSALGRLTALDDLYHSMTLNDVTRRASKAQGVALLTLFSKGLTKPQLVTSEISPPARSSKEDEILRLVDDYKLKIRREDVHGHLPICWGILTAALWLSLERSQYLHLFLHARSLLSASIRLNTLGPYAAQQILLHVVRGIVEGQIHLCRNLRSGLQMPVNNEDGDLPDNLQCAATTWPLGEILAARHDLQHSRIFNS